VLHGAHAAAGLVLLAASPWPGAQRQSLSAVLAGCVVFLKAGHATQKGRRELACPPGEWKPCAQGRHGLSVCVGAVVSSAFRLVEAKRKSSSDNT